MIAPETTMRELLEIYPGAQRALFKKYHIGGCSSCGFRPEETLEEVCVRNGQLAVHDVIDHIQTSQQADEQMQIEPAELASQLRNGGSATLVDVRTREEFDAARIDGAALFTQEMMQEALTKWDRGALTVFICHHGIRSMDAAAYFAGHGFTNVKSLRGGVDAWSTEVDPAVPRYHLD